MALKKIEEQASGHSCEYHKIAQIEVRRGQHVTCYIETYKDSAARTSNKKPAIMREYLFPESDINYNNNFISQCYDKVKAAMFPGADDV